MRGFFCAHAGSDPVDQLTLFSELGFRAFEDNWMQRRTVADQDRITQAAGRLGMEIGVIVNSLVHDRPTLVRADPAERARLVAEVETTGEVARRVGATYVTTLSGRTLLSVHRDYQTTAVIENLKWMGEAAVKAGIILALEPINGYGWPGMFVTSVPHAHLIVSAVDMPSVCFLYDVWHQQRDGGDHLENLAKAAPKVGYVQISDSPGRTEPGTGEINLKTFLTALVSNGYSGMVGLEFDPSEDGQMAERRALSAIVGLFS